MTYKLLSHDNHHGHGVSLTSHDETGETTAPMPEKPFTEAADLHPPEKFCVHGLGLGFACSECGEVRKGVHEVPWNEAQQAYVWPLPREAKTEDATLAE